jgi:hypothetical protein
MPSVFDPAVNQNDRSRCGFDDLTHLRRYGDAREAIEFDPPAEQQMNKFWSREPLQKPAAMVVYNVWRGGLVCRGWGMKQLTLGEHGM